MSGWSRLPLIVLVLLIGSTSSSWAQEERSNPLAPGVWALQFSIDDNFTLSNFNGAMLAVKKHFSAKSAVRAGITIRAFSADSDYSNSDTLSAPDTKTSNDDYSAALSLELLKYLRPDGRWSFFAGLGPEFGVGRSTRKHDYGSVTESLKATGWSATLNGILGGEWFASRAIGIHAEYQLSGGYNSSTDTRTSGGAEIRQENHSWSVGSAGVRFGLSAYF